MMVIARHGRTVSNASGLLLGRADPGLDDVGVDQARRLAGALSPERGVQIDRIVTSPLLRTRQTAAAIAAVTGAPVDVDERFVELDYGDWDQRPLADVDAEQWAAWRNDNDFTPPGGESLASLGRRVRSGLDELIAGAAGSNVVVVTHVSPIKAAVAWAVGGGDEMAWRLFVAPASITRIATAGVAPSLHTFNDCAHLAP